nr:hypothetical protein [uncultured Methanoregula sp.]
MKKYQFFCLVLLACACCIALPASAVIQEVTLKGAVATVNAPKNTLTIENPQQYGCSYPTSGAPVCSYTPMSTSALTGTVPDPAAFSIFKTGDPIVATSFGGAGETWITLAKLFGSRPNEEYVTDIVGDAATIPTPLAGNYSLILKTNPDCTTCTGSTCPAASSLVVIRSDDLVVANKTLLPGENLSFNGRNDGSSVSVTFVKGQAAGSSCRQQQVDIIGGAQPVSDYIVNVVPPIGMTAGKLPGAVQSSPEPLSTTPPAATAPATPAQTQKSAGLPVLAIGALCLGAVLVSAGRK